MTKPRIAILGGGAAGVTAALQLSKPGWQQHFQSITIYQQGWRLGGKGACGRGTDHRIEEHGLHIWFGFYENSFRLLNRCHEELDALAEGTEGRPRWELAFKSVEESFTRLDEIGVADHDGCGWKLWIADFFDDDDDRPWYEPDPRAPGERPDEWTVAFYLVRCLRLAADLAWSLVRSNPGPALRQASGETRRSAADLDDAIALVAAALGGDLRTLLGAVAELVDALAEQAFDQPIVLEALAIAVRALDAVVDFVRLRSDELVRANDSARRAYYVVDLMVAIARGTIEDGVIEADSFSVVDDVDLRQWLLAHGAARESVDCALIRAIVYDLGFAYEAGDPMRPSCAAGTALRGLLRAFFTYRGSLMWKMNSGMGDVVFLPFLELLDKRGVDVRFFHRVEKLLTAGGRVEEIEIDVQATVRAGARLKDYVTPAPIVPPTGPGGDGSSLAWPANPSAILADAPPAGPGAAIPPEAYESWYADPATIRVRTETLKRGDPDGFDLVVFGLPVACVPKVAQALIDDSPRWARAVEHIRTVPTQAMQLWLNQKAPELADVASGSVVSGFVEPFDTWADMSQVVAREKVDGAATVAYFCSVLADTVPPARGQAKDWLEEQRALVAAQALRFLRHDVAALWPKAVDPISGEFNWDLLVANSNGCLRLGDQYLRANVEPSERYVLSVPGSSAHRIPPADTDFDNLYAVGDWTACAIDAGCIEAAVISAMVAANAIHAEHGNPAEVEPVIGLDNP
jgi:uncharacterized protein with NAD-binding domain and iron-sulfur cluster